MKPGIHFRFWFVAGLLLWAHAVWAQDIEFTVDAFEIEGDNPLGEARSAAVLAPYLGAQQGLNGLQRAASALENALQQSGHTFYRVILPAQTVQSGIVRLRIFPFVLGEVTVEGNRFHTDENIRASLPSLREGESPNAQDVSLNLALANLNTSKRARLTFGASAEPGKLDARIEVADRDPRRYYLWANDTGSETTGDYRVGAGFQDANFLDRDHYLNGTVSTSPSKPDQVRQYGLSWRMPFYRINSLLNVFAVDSDVDSGTIAEFFDVRGSGSILGASLSRVLPRSGDYRHSVGFGVTDKSFDSDINFVGEPIGVDVRSRPVHLDYRGEFRDESLNSTLSISALKNISGGNNNDDEAYAASRAGAEQDWSALRADFDVEKTVGKFLFRGRLSGQYTDEPLISGEQFGIGGARNVRGFGEREFTGDRGLSAGIELFGPLLAHGVRFGWFVDGGVVENTEPAFGEIDRLDVMSTGLTADWQINRRLQFHIDFAHVLNVSGVAPEGTTGEDDQRVHFNVTYFSD